MRREDLETAKAGGAIGCSRCGYGFTGFRWSTDRNYTWCPNCFRDDGSGGAFAGIVDGVYDNEVLEVKRIGG